MGKRNELQVFNNEEFGQIRMVMVNKKPYAIASDVAKALGYKRPADAITAHCKGSVKYRVLTNGGEQEVKVIPQGDIVRLAVKCKLDGSDKFESWIFDDVIPSVLNNGMYATDELLDNPDLLIEVATKLKEERQARKLAESKVVIREKLLEDNKDNIEIAEQLTKTDNTYDIGVFSKALSIKGLGRNNFYRYLREKKVLMKDNVPYQSYIDYFKVIAIDNAFQPSKTLIKINGIKYVIKKLIEDEYLKEAFNVEKLLKELDKEIN